MKGKKELSQEEERKHTKKGKPQFQSSLNRFNDILNTVGNALLTCMPTNSMRLLKTLEDSYFVSWHCRHFFTCTGRFPPVARWSWEAVQTGNTLVRCFVRIYETTTIKDLRYDNSYLEWKSKDESAAELFYEQKDNDTIEALVIFHSDCKGCMN